MTARRQRDVRDVLTIGEVAARFGVDPKTAVRWTKTGRIRTSFLTPGGHRRFYADEIQRLIDGTAPRRAP